MYGPDSTADSHRIAGQNRAMTTDVIVDDPAVGQQWAYRAMYDAPSERVSVLSVERAGRKFRVQIQFLDGPANGKEVNVPRTRLRVPWAGAAAFDERMAAWKCLEAEPIDKTESPALWTVLELLVPDQVAELFLTSVDDALVVHDQAQLEVMTGRPVSSLKTSLTWEKFEGKPCFTPLASITIAQMICRQNPERVIDWILAAESSAFEKSKRGGERLSYETGKLGPSSPEYEYQHYLRYQKPVHELLRQRCGYRAVTAHERLLAAEAEVNRLNVLMADTIDQLGAYDKRRAEIVEEEHRRDRISAFTFRPVPERPLELHEIPVIRVSPPRRWPQ